MMKVVIVDFGSKFNKFGGQARIASVLYHDLKRYFTTYYIGYETGFLQSDPNTIMLSRGVLNPSLRKSKLSELQLIRFGYNLTVARHMLGIDKKEILNKMKSIRPDAIIANSIGDITLLKYLKYHGLHFKSIYIDHGSLSTSIDGYLSKEGIPLTIGTGLYAYSTKHAIKQFLNFFDMNIALNGMQLKNIRTFTPKVEYIANGLVIKTRKNAKRERELRKTYGLSAKNFVILYIGRMFDRQKNISTLIKAFLKTGEKNMRLLLIGEGPSLNDYKELAKNDRRIIFGVHVDNETLNYVYDIVNLFVLPSHWEGLSLTILEAAAHSLPIILSNDIKIMGFDKRHKIITFKTDSPTDLYKKIELVYKNRQARNSLVDTSKYIKRAFTKENMIAGYVKLIMDFAAS